MKFYQIMESGDIVKELDKVLCHCKGLLKVVGSEGPEYAKYHRIGLKCQTCGGRYTAKPIDRG